MDALGQDMYPGMAIKWYHGVNGETSDANPAGVVLPTVQKPKPAGVEEVLLVKLSNVVELRWKYGSGTHRYCVSAFYPSEPSHIAELRRTPPALATSGSSGPSKEDCELQTQIDIPYNSRQQFVKVVVYAVAEGDSEGDLLVGEATVPLADDRSYSMAEWPVMRDFEEYGVISLELEVTQKQAEASEVPATAPAPAPAPMPTPELRTPQAQAQAPRQDCSGSVRAYAIGDAVEVWSKSANQWVLGRVIKVEGHNVTFEYGDRQRILDVRAPDVDSFLRVPYSVGDAVEVFSQSAGKWIPGVVTKIVHDGLVVEYGDRMRNINLQDPLLPTYLRRCEGLSNIGVGGASNPQSPSGVSSPAGQCQVGNFVEVFSQTNAQWLQGRIVKVDGQQVSVQYGDRLKIVNLNDAALHSYFRSPSESDPDSPMKHVVSTEALPVPPPCAVERHELPPTPPPAVLTPRAETCNTVGPRPAPGVSAAGAAANMPPYMPAAAYPGMAVSPQLPGPGAVVGPAGAAGQLPGYAGGGPAQSAQLGAALRPPQAPMAGYPMAGAAGTQCAAPAVQQVPFAANAGPGVRQSADSKDCWENCQTNCFGLGGLGNASSATSGAVFRTSTPTRHATPIRSTTPLRAATPPLQAAPTTLFQTSAHIGAAAQHR